MCSYGCGNKSYCSGGCGSSSYSRLENAVYNASPIYSSGQSSYKSAGSYGSGISYMIADTQQRFNNAGIAYDSPAKGYSAKYSGSISKPVTRTYFGFADNFLDMNRPRTVFVGGASELREFAEEAFRAVTGKEFPDDIIIRVLPREDFQKANSAAGGRWSDGIQGFAINRKRLGAASEVFVRKGELDKIMLTLGHEIGHVLTRQLETAKDEEAKAFAFSIAWMQKIKEMNIANLSTAITLDAPSKNGLHDVALDFVLKKIKEGKEAYDVFEEIVLGLMRVE